MAVFRREASVRNIKSIESSAFAELSIVIPNTHIKSDHNNIFYLFYKMLVVFLKKIENHR